MGQGAKLERALISFMLDRHSTKGYTEVMPPILVNSANLSGSASCPNSPKRASAAPTTTSGSPPPPKCRSPHCIAMR